MNRNEIKELIMNEVAKLERRGKSHDYIQGQVVGMCKAFGMAGLLNREDSTALLSEILEEV